MRRSGLVITETPGAQRTRFLEVPTAVEVGRTERIRVHVDARLGTRGQQVADAVLNTAEEDMDALAEHFGNVALPELPLDIVITDLPGVERAYHHAADAPELFVDARTFPTVQPRYTRFLVTALMADIFQTVVGRGWTPNTSFGAALSRVLATSRYPRQIAGFATAAAWLDSERSDFVEQPPGPPDDPVAVGAAVLFLNWLHYQLGYPWEEIIACGASTLAETYHRLVGNGPNAYETFRREIDEIHPAGRPAELATDNPYPRARGIPADRADAENESPELAAAVEAGDVAADQAEASLAVERGDTRDGAESVDIPDNADWEETWSGDGLAVPVSEAGEPLEAVEESVPEWVEEEPLPSDTEEVAKASLEAALTDVRYPSSRKRLVEAAHAAGASQRVLDVLGRLPTRRYTSFAMVLAAVKEVA